MTEAVNHPAHYGGEDNPYEVIKIIEAWGLNFCCGNALKYIVRAGKKDDSAREQDLAKALWYLRRQVEGLEAGRDSAWMLPSSNRSARHAVAAVLDGCNMGEGWRFIFAAISSQTFLPTLQAAITELEAML